MIHARPTAVSKPALQLFYVMCLALLFLALLMKQMHLHRYSYIRTFDIWLAKLYYSDVFVLQFPNMASSENLVSFLGHGAFRSKKVTKREVGVFFIFALEIETGPEIFSLAV